MKVLKPTMLHIHAVRRAHSACKMVHENPMNHTDIRTVAKYDMILLSSVARMLMDSINSRALYS